MNDMETMRAIKVIATIALFGLSVLAVIPAAADTTKDFYIGSYRLSDGRAVDIAPSDGGAKTLVQRKNKRTDLTPTGLLMEGVSPHNPPEFQRLSR